jgi:uncharacterized membrane protein HdeD (DUF308 family)
VLFGIMAFTVPALTLVTLVLLYGVYAISDGMAALWFGVFARSGWFVLLGIVGVVAGIATFVYPGITAFALLYLIAAWAIGRGAFEIASAIQLRKEISGGSLFIFSGIFSILFGVLLTANPGAGALAVVWIIGAYAFIFGFMMLVLAFRLRGLPKHIEKFA